MVRKDDKAFKTVVDKAMTDIYKSGQINAIYDEVVREAGAAQGHQPEPADGRRRSRRWSPSPTDSGDPKVYE